MQSPKCESGRAFKGVVCDFYHNKPPGAKDFPKDLYDLCRNPMSHSAGLKDAAEPVVYFARVFDHSHNGVGWSDRELEDLERPDRPFQLPSPGIVIDPPRWTLYCDSFYMDVIDLLRRLTDDSARMRAAEERFRGGVFNWRR